MTDQPTCYRKHSFASRRSAKNALAGIRRSRPGERDTLEVYACVVCKGWHVGNRKPRKGAA